MFGLRDVFEYVECAHCGCVQIREIPGDIRKYYPPDYGAYEKPVWRRHGRIRRLLEAHKSTHRLGGRSLLGRLLCARSATPARHHQSLFSPFAWLRVGGVRPHSRILDVGCGSGKLLVDLWQAGFTDLTGVDPFIESDLSFHPQVRVRKGTLIDTSGLYDFIMLNHSFEHMAEPAAVLRELTRLLAPGGTIMLRIPVADCTAWEIYRTNWVQLDAPRHFFLHTQKSIRRLAADCGLSVRSVLQDSWELQFWGSEQYERDVPLRTALSRLSPDVLERGRSRYLELAEQANAAGRGDQACFFLSRPQG